MGPAGGHPSCEQQKRALVLALINIEFYILRAGEDLHPAKRD